MTPDEATTSAIVVANVRTLRRAKLFTAGSFAERLTEAGWTISRVGVTKLEGGYRSAVTVDQLVILGEVLRVAPGQLLKPLTIHASIVIEEMP